MSDVRAELEGLRAALMQPQPTAPEPADEKPEPQPEIETLLAELRDALANAAEDAGEAISAHPAVAISAAFLLGLIIGRVSGRI